MKIAVYAHFRPDNTIFYVGKGKENRVNSSHSRNEYWHNTVKKYGGFRSEVLAYWDSEEEAFSHEKLLISCFKDLGHKLVNLTNGGEGTLGLKRPKSFGDAVSKRLKGVKLSPERVAKCRLAMLGKKHAPKTIAKMKETRKNGTVNSRPIEVCGKQFQSITNFARFVNKMPIWIKKCIDKNRYDKLEDYYRNASK